MHLTVESYKFNEINFTFFLNNRKEIRDKPLKEKIKPIGWEEIKRKAEENFKNKNGIFESSK